MFSLRFVSPSFKSSRRVTLILLVISWPNNLSYYLNIIWFGHYNHNFVFEYYNSKLALTMYYLINVLLLFSSDVICSYILNIFFIFYQYKIYLKGCYIITSILFKEHYTCFIHKKFTLSKSLKLMCLIADFKFNIVYLLSLFIFILVLPMIDVVFTYNKY